MSDQPTTAGQEDGAQSAPLGLDAETANRLVLMAYERGRYRVRYHLIYDGGGGEWDGYYRTRLGARVAIFWNRHVASYGGSAILYERG